MSSLVPGVIPNSCVFDGHDHSTRRFFGTKASFDLLGFWCCPQFAIFLISNDTHGFSISNQNHAQNISKFITSSLHGPVPCSKEDANQSSVSTTKPRLVASSTMKHILKDAETWCCSAVFWRQRQKMLAFGTGLFECLQCASC